MAGSDTWTTPRDWTNGEFIDEDEMNEQIRDNMTWMKDNVVMGAIANSKLQLIGGNESVTTDAGGFATISFGVTFTTLLISMAMPNVSTEQQMVVSAATGSNMTISWLDNASTTVTVNWLAIGVI